MRKVGFLGAYDKTEIMLYVAKLIVSLKKTVLVIDTTIAQKAKYVVPVINPTTTYITEFQKIDVAVGFKNFEEIKEYLGTSHEEELEYDFVLIDIDSSKCVESFKMKDAYKNYFVTAFDVYSLKKGLEAIDNVEEPIKLTKIYFSNENSKDDDEYVNFLSMGYKVIWENYKIYFPISLADKEAIVENQKINKIKFSNISQQYKNSIQYITEEITKEIIQQSEIKRTIKLVEKEG